MKNKIIEVKNLTKKFKNGDDELYAVRDVSFDINKGDFVRIIGKSGSGKSTLLYQLGLLDYPTSGELIIDGTNTKALSDKQRTEFRLAKLGYVFQDYALMPSLSALENVMIPLLMQGLSFGIASKQAQNALDQVGLSNKFKNYPSQLSGGEQQRVSIARAICNNPQIVFADEPTANLDSETSELINKLIKKLNESGQTIVMVTHEAEYKNKEKNIIRLVDGKIV